MDVLIQLGYFGLWLASFLAATILPFSSEVVFSGVIVAGLNFFWCIVWATLGNWMGGMSCYYLGYLGKIEWIEKYLKIKPEKIHKMQSWLQGKGSWLAFFVFLPGIGDIIAVAMGFMRANVYVVAISMFLGKMIRYILWLQLTYGILSLF